MHTISLTAKPSAHISILAVPLIEGREKDLPVSDQENLISAYGVSAKQDSVTMVPSENGTLLIVGCGKQLNFRDFAATAVRASAKIRNLAIDLTAATEDQLREAVEGAALGAQTPNTYKKSEVKLEQVELIVDPALVNLDIQPSISLAEHVIKARALINTPANDLWPDRLAQICLETAEGTAVSVEVWDETRLEQENCGGILGVGRGSTRPPRLVKLSYQGGGKHLGLVGKGITFDTGGLSLKPAESMVGMKYDMAGAATVMAAIFAIEALKLPVTVTAILCLAENMPSGQATRPGDVLKMRNGKTVEVLNTDAEGRLVLGDGLTVLSELNPDHIVDVATLTGAATIALGNRYAGLMGRGEAITHVKQAAATAGELVWEMPLPEELRPLLDSDLADIANVKIGNRAGGMLIAGWFLSEFVPESVSWAHLDIAGPANNDGAPYRSTPKGSSGVAIRTLVQFARDLAEN